jgi:hypothetical protein
MLLTELLLNHPEALGPILRGTPPWVWALLAALIAIGLGATRTRQMALAHLAALPLAMTGLALWGVVSAFAGSGRLAGLLALWLLCAGLALAWGWRGAPPAGTCYDRQHRVFRLPGSWVPMGLILTVFLMKYGIGVQLALAPTLAHDSAFALAVTALYGALSGVFAARTLRVLRLARPTALSPHVATV